MPEIKYKKKTYAGASFPCLEMTKVQYDALPEAKKMDGTVYMITDDDGGWEAERSTYDNTASGLTVDNVQDALDELNSNIVYNKLLKHKIQIQVQLNDVTRIDTNAVYYNPNIGYDFYDFFSNDDRFVLRIFKNSKTIQVFYRDTPSGASGNWDYQWSGTLA